jgi:Uncharacterized ABC-type transport system, periplasmic component/surface lipoprotein
MVRDGKFPGGQTLTFGLSNKGVGIPAQNPNLTAAMIKTINDYAAQIAAGKIVVPTDPSQIK